jgi:hypothetical protein
MKWGKTSTNQFPMFDFRQGILQKFHCLCDSNETVASRSPVNLNETSSAKILFGNVPSSPIHSCMYGFTKPLPFETIAIAGIAMAWLFGL